MQRTIDIRETWLDQYPTEFRNRGLLITQRVLNRVLRYQLTIEISTLFQIQGRLCL